LIFFINFLYKKEKKIPKETFSNISMMIMEKSLTDDLEISGILHGILLNFDQYLKKLLKYFNDFIEYIPKSEYLNKEEKTNQLNFLYQYLKVLNLCTEEKMKMKNKNLYSNSNENLKENLKEKEIEQEEKFVSINIKGEIHLNLINSLFYWMKAFKDNKYTKRQNILFILPKVLKDSGLLALYKIVLLGCLKFIQEKRDIAINKKNEEIYENLYQSHFNYFSIDNIINENIDGFDKIKLLSKKKFFFKEDIKNQYDFTIENINFFEKILFLLINKCEKKIIKFSNFNEIEVIERKNNLLFFENLNKISDIKEKKNIKEIDGDANSNNNLKMNLNIEIDTKIKEEDFKANEKQLITINTQNQNQNLSSGLIFLSNLEVNNIIKEFLRYLNLSMEKFSQNYFKFDMFEDKNLNKIDDFYKEFKLLLNENMLIKLVCLFYLKGKNLDACILMQYVNKVDYDIIYSLIKKDNENHSLNKLEFIWKIPIFEILAHLYHKNKNEEFFSYIKDLMRRTSNHQIFKSHVLRRHFKILNFLKYIKNLNFSLIR
jgi:hypothetical protein